MVAPGKENDEGSALLLLPLSVSSGSRLLRVTPGVSQWTQWNHSACETQLVDPWEAYLRACAVANGYEAI